MTLADVEGQAEIQAYVQYFVFYKMRAVLLKSFFKIPIIESSSLVFAKQKQSCGRKKWRMEAILMAGSALTVKSE